MASIPSRGSVLDALPVNRRYLGGRAKRGLRKGSGRPPVALANFLITRSPKVQAIHARYGKQSFAKVWRATGLVNIQIYRKRDRTGEWRLFRNIEHFHKYFWSLLQAHNRDICWEGLIELIKSGLSETTFHAFWRQYNMKKGSQKRTTLKNTNTVSNLLN